MCGGIPRSWELATAITSPTSCAQVTPGTFAVPATNVSDMYAQHFYGRTAMRTLTIVPESSK